jgi:general secretion pathway protein H
MLKRQQGFTLLEIMLVVIIMGMISVGVVMSMPSINSKQGIDWQTQRLVTLLQFAQDEALISGIELGLVFTEKSYQFAFYEHTKKRWLPVSIKAIDGEISLKPPLTLSYQLAGSVWEEIENSSNDSFIKDEDRVHIDGDEKQKTLTPQVYIMSSGEVTPFTIILTENKKSSNIKISMSGEISVETSNE